MPKFWLPLAALEPDQPPDAVQLVTLPAAQLTVVLPRYPIEVGFADKDSVGEAGGGSVTVRVTDSVLRPPGPSQVRVYVVSPVNVSVWLLPRRPLLPDHPPEPVQLSAFVESHCRVER